MQVLGPTGKGRLNRSPSFFPPFFTSSREQAGVALAVRLGFCIGHGAHHKDARSSRALGLIARAATAGP